MQLHDPQILTSLLQQFSCWYPRCIQAAIVSQWSMNYFSKLLPAVIGSALTLNTAIEVWEGGVELVHDEARPVALKVKPVHAKLCQQQLPHFVQNLLHAHLEPLVNGLATIGNIAPKVLWNNLVAAWDVLFDRLHCYFPAREDFATAHRWLEQASVNNGKHRLRRLQRMVASPAPELSEQIPFRVHCCLHFQLHETVEGQFPVWCESCPKLHRRPQEEQIRYLYQIYLENLECDA